MGSFIVEMKPKARNQNRQRCLDRILEQCVDDDLEPGNATLVSLPAF